MKIKFTQHARERIKKSGVRMGYLIKEVSCIKNIEGKIRWMTEKGVLVLLKVSENLIIVKTFISKQRYRGKGHKYYQGCEVY